jgi:hypothetical protein
VVARGLAIAGILIGLALALVYGGAYLETRTSNVSGCERALDGDGSVWQTGVVTIEWPSPTVRCRFGANPYGVFDQPAAESTHFPGAGMLASGFVMLVVGLVGGLVWYVLAYVPKRDARAARLDAERSARPDWSA